MNVCKYVSMQVCNYASMSVCQKVISHFYQEAQNRVSKQGMELFSPFQTSDLKLIYQMFFISTNEFKIDFQNRKWNYPNRKPINAI